MFGSYQKLSTEPPTRREPTPKRKDKGKGPATSFPEHCSANDSHTERIDGPVLHAGRKPIIAKTISKKKKRVKPGKPGPCVLFDKYNLCGADSLDDELCDTCPYIHPTAIHDWRRDHPEFDDLFEDIDKNNERRFMCVVRRRRYAASAMAREVISLSRELVPVLYFPGTPAIIWCERTDEADTVCDRCRAFMDVDMFSKYFNKDGTVKGDGSGEDEGVRN
jgi:hypothetical protein